ncbi:hypothetical protein FN846DRAFT_913731 [Sphaerosporella brunnea]|uniref:Tyrosinase copper-binding domain-containing protein n=1 Tax=Sphaerosporella brunnea TaxID=1250544 RepID=A0A5J5EE95_9PEZI|nr:hypothetical protein FN846DRAFT_913731 [Sphaerosporella brunnea]
MRFTTVVAIGLATIGVHAELPYPEKQPFGYEPAFGEQPMRVRKEWRQLTIPERLDYIRAVKCMHETPGIYRDLIPSSMTLFEDFAGVHKQQTPYIHWESQFLPWHRYFLWTWENALRKQCDYEGAIPYWDYALDAPPNNLKESPIFDPEHGFGGDGFKLKDPFYPLIPPGMPPGSGGGCQQDGPFADWTLHIARGNLTGPRDDRCLTRSINDKVSRDWCTRATEEVIKRQPNYQSLYQNMQGASIQYTQYFGLHLCGHFIVAGPGAGADVYIGSTDPLFFPHHANLDRIWWEWQSKDLEKRVKDMSGPLRPPLDRFPGSNYTGFPTGDITMDWYLDVGRLAPPVRTENVMHIQRGMLNYKYTNPLAKWEDGHELPLEEQTEEEKREFEKAVRVMERRWATFKNVTWGPGGAQRSGGVWG